MIRQATKSDTDRIVELCKQFYHTTEYIKFAPYNEESIRTLTDALIENGVVLVAVLEGRVVGVVGLVLTPFPFNQDIIGAYEIVFYVDPDAQGQRIGQELLAAVDPACREAGATLVQMVYLHTSPSLVAGLYQKLGYHYTETCYTKVF